MCMDPCSLMESPPPCSNSHQPSACTTYPGGSSGRPELPNNPCREWDALDTSISVPRAARVNAGLPFNPGILLCPSPLLPACLGLQSAVSATEMKVRVAMVFCRDDEHHMDRWTVLTLVLLTEKCPVLAQSCRDAFSSGPGDVEKWA